MNPLSLPPFANHLWQSTLFAAVAGLLTLALRRNRARVRHAVWLAASIKFLIPLSVLIALGSYIPWRTTPVTTQSNVTIVMDRVSRPFVLPAVSLRLLETEPPARSPLPDFLAIIWLCGFLGIACSWWIRWRRVRATVRAGSPLQLKIPIQARSSAENLEPGVFGIFRPILLLPKGIFDRLTPTQMEAVIAHELCHVRNRDNLSAAIQMLVETVFWFHPLVWWMGNRMTEERERACDEEVLRLGSEPRAYAEGILNICKLYMESPLTCVSGITGPNLRKRIETIMANRIGVRLNFTKKLALAAAGIGAVAVPIVIGTMNAPSIRAQSSVESVAAPRFDAASIKPNTSGSEGSRLTPAPGRIDAENVPVELLIQAAFSVNSFQILGGPGWIRSDRFDIRAKAEGTPTSNQMILMLQLLLEDRFELKFHRETKELPIYTLAVAKSGFKLHESNCTDRDSTVPEKPPVPGQEPARYCDGMRGSTKGNLSSVDGGGVAIGPLTRWLSQMLGRPVVDRTGLNGRYDFHLEFSPEQLRAGRLSPLSATEPGSLPTSADIDGPSIFTALQQQFGLKLSPDKGPAEVIVIDHIERPSEN